MKLLTKSLFTTGVYCPELMWFSAFAKDELPELSASELARMEQGTRVGLLATQRHPTGIRVDAEGFTEYLEQSQSLLTSGVALFEPAFMADRQYCRVDMLLATQEGWDVVEVKSGTSIKEVNLWDVAFQVDTLRKAGVEINRAYMLHINSSYVRKGDVDIHKLFTKVDVTEDIEPFLAQMNKQVSSLCAVLDSPRPETTIMHSCTSPYGCPLPLDASLPEHNVTELYWNNGKQWLDKDLLLITDIVDGAGLTPKQYIQWQAVTTNTPQVNVAKLSAWLSKLKYPLYHLDFETINPAVPLFEDTKPYQRIPFQFSLHIQQEDGSIVHHEYLHAGSDDPREELVKALRIITGSGSILAHNASFERGVLQELLQVFPKETWITKAVDRLVDTIVPFRNFWYYHPAQHGSCSLKAVLPALTGSGYKGLEIAGGDDASMEFLRITQEEIPAAERERVRTSLLAYCKQDTQAMVDILSALISAVQQ